MSRRLILSRPRTKMYDANYDIGQSYYKSAIDRLDRKYSGRSLSPPRQTPVVPQEVLDRHDRAFFDEDLPTARRRAEKHITEDNMFDKIKARRPLSTALEAEDEFDDEVSNTVRRMRTRQKVAKILDDVSFEDTVNNATFGRMVNRTDKLLDSVGLNEKTASRILDEEPSYTSRRMLKITASEEDTADAKDMTRWSAIKSKDEQTSAAAFRARQTRARLDDLEDEMEAVAERKAARERRAANLRALVQENAEETEALQSAMKVARIGVRTEKKSVAF